MSGIKVGVRVRPWNRSLDGKLHNGDAVAIVMDDESGALTITEEVSTSFFFLFFSVSSPSFLLESFCCFMLVLPSHQNADRTERRADAQLPVR